MKKLILLFVVLVKQVSAQDPHFSQYFSSPLTLNPANTGNFDGPFRVAMNFRNQWQGIADPFVTGTASFESQLAKGSMGNGNRLAAGILGFYDKGLSGGYVANYLGTSIGYHLWLDEDQRHKLSVGFQTVLVNKRLDFTKLTFSNQLTSGGFDMNLSSDELVANSNFGYLDWNAGLMYTAMGNKGNFYVGASLYHLTQPVEGYLEKKNIVPVRTVLQMGYTHFFNETGSIMSSAQYQSQSGMDALTLGAALGRKLSSNGKDILMYAGGWVRLQESVIPYLGLLYDNIQFGLSYDIVTDSRQTARLQNRSVEISMIYNFRDLKNYKRLVPWY
jgi:type IX secretion system PorP/SprF family membrane protein